MTDRDQQGELIFSNANDKGEATPLPTPTSNSGPDQEAGAATDDVALEKTDEVEIKFTRQPDGSIIGQAPSMNGLPAYDFELQNMNWGLFEDIEDMQQVPDEKRMRTMLDFLTTYVVGGPRMVPLEHTRTIFEAITTYASVSMDSSKN